MNVALFDLDGTLALHTAREWDQYDLLHMDAVCPSVLALAIGIAKSGVRVIFLTGRPELYERETREWLTRAMPPDVDFDLICRPSGDRSSNALFKASAVDAIRDTGNIIVLAVEDYDKTVRMFHERGIPTLYVVRETTKPFLISDQDRADIDALTDSVTWNTDALHLAKMRLRKRAGLSL